MKDFGTPCAVCASGQHNRCSHQWGSPWCTCSDPDCQRRRYNTAVRKAVDHANRLGLLVRQDALDAAQFPPLYDDIRVALIVPTGVALTEEGEQ